MSAAKPAEAPRPQFGRMALQQINQLIGDRDRAPSLAGRLAECDLGKIDVLSDGFVARLTPDRAKALIKAIGADVRDEIAEITSKLAQLGYVDDAPDAAPALPLEPQS